MLFESIDQLWLATVNALLAAGNPAFSRAGNVTGEIIGFSGSLDADRQMTFLTNERRNLSKAYASGETLWYLSGKAETAMMERYAPSYAKYGPVAYGAYGPRVMPQMQRVVDVLLKDPLSRQAVVSIWRPDDLGAVTPDMPCTLSHQYLVRNAKVHMVVTMRSNDVWLGMPYDIFAFTCFQRIIAGELGLGVGEYHHRVGSMHLYEKNYAAALEATSTPHHRRPFFWRFNDTLETCRTAVLWEEALRTRSTLPAGVGHVGDMCKWMLDACKEKLCT